MTRCNGNLTRFAVAAVVAAFTLLAAACGTGTSPTAPASPSPTPSQSAAPTATATAQPTATATPPPPAPTPDLIAAALRSVPGIVRPDNLGWPREVETDQGRITLNAPPQRIHTLSLGHDEIIVALIGAGRLAGIGSFTADPVYSNIAAEVKDVPKVTRDAEKVLGLNPDLVIASKFTRQDLLDRIKGAGVPVARTSLESSSLGNIPNILLLGYMLGAEGRALALASEIKERIVFVGLKVEKVPPASKVRALSIAKFADTIDAAGSNSTEGGILTAAGADNAAAQAGIDGHKNISVESIAAMDPDVIILTQPADSGEKFRDELYAAPALAHVKAVKNKRIVVGVPRYYTTLSHWNVRGIEESARLFYPDLFQDVAFKDFALSEGRR